MHVPWGPGESRRAQLVSALPRGSSASSSLPLSPRQYLQDDSDIKTYRPFVTVMHTLCKCKEQASKTLSR